MIVSGTIIFEDKNGRPVLRRRYGNRGRMKRLLTLMNEIGIEGCRVVVRPDFVGKNELQVSGRVQAHYKYEYKNKVIQQMRYYSVSGRRKAIEIMGNTWRLTTTYFHIMPNTSD